MCILARAILAENDPRPVAAAAAYGAYVIGGYLVRMCLARRAAAAAAAAAAEDAEDDGNAERRARRREKRHEKVKYVR